ncbi:PEP/pyruvate-binding domain-containing protein [Kitasatospora cineracea]
MTTALPSLDQPLRTATAGAKAAALSRLAAAGLPVPAGIVIPVDHPDEHLPQAAAEILTRHHAPHGLIARSSATTEDGTSASFAGLFTSRTTPADAAPLLEAIRAVRACAHHPTIAAYSRTRSVSATPSMAVLVQATIRPACSGVLAADVTDGTCTRWRIETLRGLAEPLVSGTRTGEIHTGGTGRKPAVHPTLQDLIHLPGTPQELDMPPGEWTTLGPGTRTRAKISTSADGVLLLHTPAHLADHPILTTSDRARLLALAALAATVLGLARIDVEWAIDHRGDLHLLQARPLTAPLTHARPGAPADRGDGILHGIAAAPGHATGPATHTDDHLAGKVLLCRDLGPAAVPALLTGPAAVVATTGGELSHTAIITRELGIPCVTNITDAFTAIAPGTIVDVDGHNGTVRPAGTVPAQRTTATPQLADAAVLTYALHLPPPDDGRAATLLFHDTHHPLPTLPAAAAHPVGILLPAELPAPAAVPPGTRPIRLPGLGTLLWPCDAPPPPTHIVVLGPDGHVLHRRTATR